MESTAMNFVNLGLEHRLGHRRPYLTVGIGGNGTLQQVR